jgi:two-component system, response regulator PdtaR
MTNENILVVEDSAITSTLIKNTLLAQGYHVAAVVDNGPESIQIARELKPDIVLMDIILKGKMTGIEAAREIRKTLGIPVIYLTAQSDDATVVDAITTDPFGYLIKPLEERALKTSIQIALYKRAMEEKLLERERTISVLLNAVPDSLALLDQRLMIVAVNEPMAEKLGTKSEMLIGMTLDDLSARGIMLIPQDQINTIYVTKDPVWFEEKKGDAWFETTIFPVTDRDGRVIRFAIQSHDITFWKELESELKTEGISHIEHNMEQFQILNDQIRNPLQAIHGYSALSDNEYSSRIAEQVAIINNLVARLDKGWVESEKVRSFLMRHYDHGRQILPKHRQSVDVG